MGNFDDLPRRKTPTSGSGPLTPHFKYPQFPDGIPRPLSPREMPSKYKPALRRVRVMIIALPIAIVTSYVLWNRLVKGEERKILIRHAPNGPDTPPRPPPPAAVDSSNVGPTAV